ncbi:MAG TPA: hypothetical protein VGL55_14400 [Steroidobacteraceae bacterium]
MTTKKTTPWRLWQPPGETIDAIAGVLSAHWAAAKSLQPETLWTRPANWLRRQANRLVDPTAPLVEEHDSPESEVTI